MHKQLGVELYHKTQYSVATIYANQQVALPLNCLLQ